ncbi:RDD family protein [Paenibacillus sp. PAMC21692]|uniref:RDD family protein n=1 Tax=Paenibacillus sp. PAMC21692 TaxID=2762320 RepID=UPI00164DC019|nr:RDD family protein [Paenibacillus sp. PAMC21692]QNK54589.1 RDD family protein [Paenibacillus sp. PAMC21692]
MNENNPYPSTNFNPGNNWDQQQPLPNDPAGFWIRFGAILLDGLIIGIPLSVLSLILTGGSSGESIFTNVLSFLYALLLPVFWNGYTIGKKICSIRIIRVINNEPPHIGNMLMRNVVWAVIVGVTFGIALIVDWFMVGLREDKRGIHDFIAGTQVVRV